MKKIILLLVLCLLVSGASAELVWPAAQTPAQEKLQTYISDVNTILIQQGSRPINSLFEHYTGFASLAVTANDNAEVPENVELTVTMDADTLCVLTLRTSSIEQFIPLAGACIQAACPSMSWKEAKKDPESYATRVNKSPGDSFSDTVSELKGTSLRTYFSYAPNQFRDGANWITMTMVFPLEGYEDNGVYVTYTPAPISNSGEEYEGYSVGDDYIHFEVFVTETPSPEDGIVREGGI